MLHNKIIRAWKDPEYRASMSEEEQSQLPENPAGAIELTDDELDMATGGQQYVYQPSYRPSSMSSQRPSSMSSSQSASSRSSQSASSNPSQSASSNSSRSASSNPSQSASSAPSRSASSNPSQSASGSWRPWSNRPSYTWRRNFQSGG